MTSKKRLRGRLERLLKQKKETEEFDGLLNRAGPDYYQATLILTKVSV